MTSESYDDQSVGALAPGQPAERRGLVSRIRTSRSVAPELVALMLLYLGGLGADSIAAADGSGFYGPIGVFFAGLLGLLAPALLVLGSWMIWLSQTPKLAEKWIAVASAILFPLVLSLISPSLPGRYESCEASSGYDPNTKAISSFTSCRNGPNWVTHTVHWTWILLPLVVSLTLAALSLRRRRREQIPEPAVATSHS